MSLFVKHKKTPLINMFSILKKAQAEQYAVAHININNLEWIKAVLSAAQETSTPIIIGVSEGAAKYMCGFKNVVDMVSNTITSQSISVPVSLHLDHGSFEGCAKALEAGFSSVMFDGSSLPFEKNIEMTQKIIKYAKKFGASVEAEVGAIGGTEDGVSSNGELADVEQCKAIASLPIACLAAGIGNIHGIYPSNWKGLNFERLQQISLVANNVPLVLHGGTGIPDDMIKHAISLGVCKINVNTECQIVFAEAMRQYITNNKDIDVKNKGFDPRKIMKPGMENIKKKCIEKFQTFGCFGKA